MKTFILLVMLCMALSGCASRSSQVSTKVSKQVEDRTGYGVNPNPRPSAFALPPGISLAAGLTEDDAVAIALWNNGAFLADLTALGFARADLIEAGQLRNPMLTLLFPWGPKQLEMTATLPLEVFWQRPRRVAAATVELERVGESMVQTGLNLVRDVRIAYTELALASERARIAAETLDQRSEVAHIVYARFRAGDISEMETAASRLEVRQAAELLARLQSEVAVSKERLRFLLGMSATDTTFDTIARQPEPPRLTSTVVTGPDSQSKNLAVPASNTAPAQTPIQQSADELSALVKAALASRPDLRAAELAIEAAGKRAKWERSKIFSLSAILDANAQGKEGFEAGPGVTAELPIFNRNKGGITRAEAEVERAARQYVATRQRIVLEVREAYTQLQQFRQAHIALRTEILPVIEEEIDRAGKAYADGEVAYLFVLETSRKRYDARLQEAEAIAAQGRAIAQLERAVGKKIREGSNR